MNTTKRPARFLLQMRDDLREALQTSADRNGRTLTAEINARLRVSIEASGPTLQSHLAREEAARTVPGIAPSAPILYPSTAPNGQPVHLSDHDMAMLRVFHALRVEKQLALLSLFSPD